MDGVEGKNSSRVKRTERRANHAGPCECCSRYLNFYSGKESYKRVLNREVK